MLRSVEGIEVVITALSAWLMDSEDRSVYANLDTTISMTYAGFKIKTSDSDSNAPRYRVLHMIFDPHRRSKETGTPGPLQGGVSTSMVSFDVK